MVGLNLRFTSLGQNYWQCLSVYYLGAGHVLQETQKHWKCLSIKKNKNTHLVRKTHGL